MNQRSWNSSYRKLYLQLPPTAARCFAFCADDLLVHASTGQVDVPTRELLAQAGIKGEREFYLGSDRHYGPCFAVELGADYTPPDGFQLHGLRDLASPLGDLLFPLAGARCKSLIGLELTATADAAARRRKAPPLNGLKCVQSADLRPFHAFHPPLLSAYGAATKFY